MKPKYYTYPDRKHHVAVAESDDHRINYVSLGWRAEGRATLEKYYGRQMMEHLQSCPAGVWRYDPRLGALWQRATTTMAEEAIRP